MIFTSLPHKHLQYSTFLIDLPKPRRYYLIKMIVRQRIRTKAVLIVMLLSFTKPKKFKMIREPINNENHPGCRKVEFRQNIIY